MFDQTVITSENVGRSGREVTVAYRPPARQSDIKSEGHHTPKVSDTPTSFPVREVSGMAQAQCREIWERNMLALEQRAYLFLDQVRTMMACGEISCLRMSI